MVLVRLAYVADLPVPADLVRTLSGGAAAGMPSATSPSPPAGERVGVRGAAETPAPPSPALGPAPSGTLSRTAGEGLATASRAVPTDAAVPVPAATPETGLAAMPQSFAEVLALFDSHREALLRSHLWSHVHLVAFEPGRIEFRPDEGAPRDLANRLGQLLGEWTGCRWIVAISQAAGAATLAEQEASHASSLRNEIAAHPLVRAALETFPGATIAAIRERSAGPEVGAEEIGAETAPDDGGDEAGEDDASTGEAES
jgi:DNA polymerase III subunit gamma/tau